MPDVSMASSAGKDAAQDGDAAKAAAAATPPPSPKDLTLHLLRHNLALVVRSVAHLEPRFAARAMRTISSTRKLCLLHPDVLATTVEEGTAKGA